MIALTTMKPIATKKRGDETIHTVDDDRVDDDVDDAGRIYVLDDGNLDFDHDADDVYDDIDKRNPP